MDIITLKILLLFLPGIICQITLSNLIYNSKKDFKYFIVYSFILGFISYYFAKVLINFLNLITRLNIQTKIDFFNFFTSISNEKAKEFAITPDQILWACASSIIFAALLALFINRGWIYKPFHWFKISNTDGLGDVWNKVFGSVDNGSWVIIHDHDNNLIYQGRVYHHSDFYENSEIFLKGVIVYDEKTKVEIERRRGLYLTRKHNNLTIEFPDTDTNEDFPDRDSYYTPSIIDKIKFKMRF
jgi:hypothetical protein